MIPVYPNLYKNATNIVKKRVSRWPSAYASGQVVQLYKTFVKEKYGRRAKAYIGAKTPTSPLARWYAEEWVDILSGNPCGSVKSNVYYPVCRPRRIARRLTPAQILNAVKRKQRTKKKTASYPPYFRAH